MSLLTHNEKKYVKHLDHPNILPIYELAQCEDELPFSGPALRREPRRAAVQRAQLDSRDRLSTADKFSYPAKFFGTSPSSFRRSKDAPLKFTRGHSPYEPPV